MSQAMYTAASGIANAQTQIGVVSNNIANMSTTAFKQSAVTFSDVFYSTISNGSPSTFATGGVNPKEVGYGSEISSISTDFTTGTYQPTGSETDMMIEGNGYFTVQSSANETLYTRAGHFTLDSEGYLVMPNGYKVLGTDKVSGASGTPTPIKVPAGLNAAKAGSTTDLLSAKTLSDLNGLTEKIVPGTFKVSVTSTDTQEANITITKDDTMDSIKDKIAAGIVAAGATDVTAADFTVSLADGKLSITKAATSDITGLTFSDTGSCDFVAKSGLTSTTDFATDGCSTDTLDWQLTGEAMNGGADDTKYASMAIDENGSIQLTFANGDKLKVVPDAKTNTLGFEYTTAGGVIIDGANVKINSNVISKANLQMQMATFINQEGLEQNGSNLYSVGANSGPALYGIANANAFGAIKSGGYESSNVNLTDQFANMIIAQRSVEANSRVFDTANQIMKSLTYMGQ